MEIRGLAAIVTGGGGGLGAATARALAGAGARVAVLDVDEANAVRVAGEIGGLALACDVTSEEAGAAAVARAREANGPARVLVNCAGIAIGQRVVGRDGAAPLADFRRVVEVNLVGSYNMMRLAAADMAGLEPLAGGERGVVVSTASVAAFDGQIGQCAYGASKAGIVGLSLPAARELARFGIRVMAIAPGLFATPMLLGMPKEVQDSLAAQPPFPNRLGTPEEYAQLVLHIVGNAMLNGECIRLDGALRLAPK